MKISLAEASPGWRPWRALAATHLISHALGTAAQAA